MSIQTNLHQVNHKIIQAAKRAGRDPVEVKLVVAGKYADTNTTLQAIKAGAKIIGENRQQDLRKKFAVIGNQVDWHFIGHLQRNKVKSVIKMVSMIHSIDSLKLAQEIDTQLIKLKKKLPVLIEVNTSKELSKFGVSPKAAIKLAQQCSQFKYLNLVGLMTMGALVSSPEENRDNFRVLRQLVRKIESLKIPNTSMQHLSMGTTQDFEVAIEEGATLVRIGSAIFHD